MSNLKFLIVFICFKAFATDIVITNESIKKHFEDLNKPKKTKKVDDEITLKKDNCLKLKTSVRLINEKMFKDLASRIKWPINRKFPLEPLTKKDFLADHSILFSKTFNIKTSDIKEKNNYCIVKQGLIWAKNDKDGGKIVTINHTSFKSSIKLERLKTKLLSKLPKKYRNSVPIFSCNVISREYRVFYNDKSNNYVLQVIKKEKETDLITNGQKKRTQYVFKQNKTVLTLERSDYGYELSLSSSKGSRKFNCI